MNRYFFCIVVGLWIFSACQENTKLPPNPFDQQGGDSTTVTPPPDVDPNSIVGLHYNIFRPTCANSGCHDGTFEPDFRTVESAYNTLVSHPIIKNDPGSNYTYRVKPGDAEASVLWARLTFDIDGQSGIMPLVVDPGSDWDEKKEQYLQNVKTWINSGARDMFGNPPVAGNIQPSMRGVIAFANGGSTPLPRDALTGPVLVPGGTSSLEIWISLADDNAKPQELQYNKVRFSTDINGFQNAPESSLTIAASSVTELGYFGDPVPYYHKITINPSSYPSGERLFMRVYVKDPALTEVTEIPADGSANYMKDYFSFEIP